MSHFFSKGIVIFNFLNFVTFGDLLIPSEKHNPEVSHQCSDQNCESTHETTPQWMNKSKHNTKSGQWDEKDDQIDQLHDQVRNDHLAFLADVSS